MAWCGAGAGQALLPPQVSQRKAVPSLGSLANLATLAFSSVMSSLRHFIYTSQPKGLGTKKILQLGFQSFLIVLMDVST